MINPPEFDQWVEDIRGVLNELAESSESTTQEIGLDSSIPETGILDSAGIINFIGWFEDHFEVAVANDEFTMSNLGTINAMVAFLQRKKDLAD